MSHYAVAVFSDDCNFDRLLAPYNENDRKYFVFQPIEFEVIEANFNKFKVHNQKWTLDMYIKNFGYTQEDGRWGYWHNPNGYWDWYSLDGADYLFDFREDAEPSDNEWTYRKNDYEWYPDGSAAEDEAAEFWDKYIDTVDGFNDDSIWNREYFLERYKTRNQYVKECGRTIPYAFITPDGVWHSAGCVYEFAESDETLEDAKRYTKEWDDFIQSDANPYVNLVDCHI